MGASFVDNEKTSEGDENFYGHLNWPQSLRYRICKGLSLQQ